MKKILHLLLGCCLLAVLPLTLKAQVGYDNNAQCDAPDGSGTSADIFITIPAKSKEMLIVLVRGSASSTLISLTFNGTPLTRYGSAVSNNGARAEAWYLPLGNLTSSMSGFIFADWPSSITYRAITAASFNNVDQTTPISALAFNPFSPTATSSSVTIPGSSGDMVMEAISCIGANINAPPVFTPTSGQIELTSCSSLQTNSFRQSAAYKAQTSSSLTLGWGVSSITPSTNNGLQLAVNLKKNTVLPIQLVDFQATPQENFNVLHWETASEHNSHHFEIQHSTNGVEFSRLGEVAATGESQQPKTYTFRHQQPLKGTHYYRLKSVDRDGTAELSAIIFTANGRETGSVAVYPNPATDKIQLETEDREQAVHLYNVQGKLIYQAASVPEYLELTAWPEGLYLLQIGTTVTNLVKK